MSRPWPRTTASGTILDRRHYAWLAAGYLALSLYGSLVPFHFGRVPLAEAVGRIRELPYQGVAIQSRSDWVANVLLFIPLSYLAMATLCVDRRRRVALAGALIVPLGCGLLSLAIECTQVFFPPRITALHDVIAESIGGVIGTAVWIVRGRRITAWGRQVWGHPGSADLAAHLLPGYLTLLVLIHVMPLDLTISPVEIVHKYREGRVHLVPFAALDAGATSAAEALMGEVASYLPAGLLLAGRRRVGLGRLGVLALGLGLAGAIELMQVFVSSRTSDSTSILAGGLAVLLGWETGRRTTGRSAQAPLAGPEARPARIAQPGVSALLALGWVGLLVAHSWSPFRFRTDPAWVAERLRDVSRVPFADYWGGTEYHAFDQLVRRVLLFLPVGVLLAPRKPGARPGRAGALALLAGLALAGVLEAGQLFLPDRFPSPSDLLVELCGIWLGLMFARRLRESREPREKPFPLAWRNHESYA